MDNYLDFGSDSESDEGEGNDFAMDSDEEEAIENERLYKMLMSKSEQPRRNREVDDFEAEMEADLDKRVQEVEIRGGVEHQKSLSRSSSSSSLNKSPCPSPSPSFSKAGSSGKRGILMTSKSDSSLQPPKKTVKFVDSSSSTQSSTPMELTNSEGISGVGKVNKKDDEKKEEYDQIYFDSDESEGEDEPTKKKKKEKRSFKSNDELFYDEKSDARDQAWVDRKRRQYCKNTTKPSSSKSKDDPTNPLPTSDAVLNCPACFTVLCLDCQRHELYAGQYRAMFVMNCNIVKEEVLHVPLKEPKWKKKGKNPSGGDEQHNNSNSNPANLPANDSFNPVKCKICKTQVAVYDSEEVYHFFNILPSHA